MTVRGTPSDAPSRARAPGRSPIDLATSALMASLRGWSALVVVLVHAFQVFVLPYLGLYGWPHLLTSWLACYAVLTFFVVSGFMIAVSVHRHRVPGGFAQWAFFRARFLRIYPPLLASVALCAVVLLVFRCTGLHGSESFRLGGELFLSRERVEMGLPETVSTLLLAYTVVPHAPGPIQINGPLWTLTYEWWFYVFAMFACAAVIGRRVVLGAVPALVVLLIFACSPAGTLLWVFLTVWGAGFALACAYLEGLLDRRRAPLCSRSSRCARSRELWRSAARTPCASSPSRCSGSATGRTGRCAWSLSPVRAPSGSRSS